MSNASVLEILQKERSSKVLTAVIIFSVLVRALAAFALGNDVTSLPGTADQVSYHNLALRVVDGHGFSFGRNWWPMTAANSPTAHWSYLYTGYLAAIYSIFRSPLAARLLQVLVVGTLHPYLAYRIGKRAFGDQAGLIAAGITCLYAYFIYYSGTLMTEPFFITTVLGVLYLAIRLAEAETCKNVLILSVWFGLLIGAAILFRQLFILLVPWLFVWLWAAGRGRNLPTLFRVGLVVGGITALMILPFTVYNYARFDRFVLLNTNAGYAFYLANHPIHGTDFIPANEMESYQSLIPVELRSLDEAALDQVLLKRGMSFVSEDPLRYLLLSLDRIPEYFKFWPSAESSKLSNISRVASFGLTFPWMLAGIWIWVRSRSGSRFLKTLGEPGSLLLVFAVIYSAIHILSWALIRYRLPADAALIPFAGLAVASALARIVCSAESWRIRQGRPVPPPSGRSPNDRSR